MAVHFTTAEQNPNLIACCKISHDTIGDCLGKVFDMFKVIGTTQVSSIYNYKSKLYISLFIAQLPLANVVNSSQSFNDRKQKCQDTIQTLAKLIRKVKLLYDKIEEETKNMYPLSLQVKYFYILFNHIRRETENFEN